MTNHKSNEYKSRSDLAHKLTELRGKKRIPFIQKSGKKLAENLLAKQRSTDIYEDNLNRKYAELLENKDWLPKIFDKKIAISLILDDRARLLAKHIDRFSPSDHKEIAMRMIAHLDSGTLLSNIKHFQWLDYKEIAMKILSNPQERELFLVWMNEFPSLDRKEIAIYLTEKHGWWLIAKNLDKFSWLDEDFIAQRKKDLSNYEEWLHKEFNISKERNDRERVRKEEIKIASKNKEKKEKEKTVELRKKIFLNS